MKLLPLIGMVCLALSCGERSQAKMENNSADTPTASDLNNSETERIEQFVIDYIAAVNSKNWKQELQKYLKPNSEAFLEDHTAFRNSFPNFKATIKHLVVNGNEAILWLEISANYVEDYTFDKSDYGDDVIHGIKARNQPVLWNETWYFDVVDGKFGDKWDFLKDHHKILRDLGALSPT